MKGKLNKHYPSEPSEAGKMFNEATDDGLAKLLADLARNGDSNISLAVEDQDGSLGGGGGEFGGEVSAGGGLGADLASSLTGGAGGQPDLAALLSAISGVGSGSKAGHMPESAKGMPVPQGKPVELQIKEAKMRLLQKPGQLLKSLKK